MCYLFRRIAISEYYHIPSTTTLLCGGCLSGPELHHYRTEHSRCSSERATAEGSGFPAGLPSLLAWLVGCSVYGENFSVESRPWGLCVAGPAKKRGGVGITLKFMSLQGYTVHWPFLMYTGLCRCDNKRVSPAKRVPRELAPPQKGRKSLPHWANREIVLPLFLAPC